MRGKRFLAAAFALVGASAALGGTAAADTSGVTLISPGVVSIAPGEKAPSPPTPSLPSAISLSTDQSWVCQIVKEPVTTGFVPTAGYLSGDGAARFAVLPAPSSLDPADPCGGKAGASRCITTTLAGPQTDQSSCRVLRAAGTDQLVVVADGMHDAFGYEASVPLGPSKDAKTSFTINRHSPWWKAVGWIVAGVLAATLAGLVGTRAVAMTKTSLDAAQLRVDADNDYQALRKALHAIKSDVADRDGIVRRWNPSALNALTGADLTTALTRYHAAAAAAADLCADLKELEDLDHGLAATDLFGSMVAALAFGPQLATASPWVVQTAVGVQPALAVLNLARDLLARDPKTAEKNEIEKVVAEAAAIANPNEQGVADKIYELGTRLAKLQVATAPPDAPGGAARITDEFAALHVVMSSRQGRTYRAPQPPHLRTPRARRERLHVLKNLHAGLEVAAFVLASVIGVVLALSTQYFSDPTWGSTADLWAAFTWSFSTAGAVQVAKVALLAAAPISTGS
ncbi:MAG TPA: hypothetical protein VHD81_03625 [Mycobacteriales bacterium]|nr:hypothetical protein [Mycobacteriales bacterium]